MKKILLVTSILFIAALSYATYQYFRPSASIKNVEPELFISAIDLKRKMAEGQLNLEQFGNTVLLTEGTITSIERAHTTTVLIDSSVRCELGNSIRLNKEKDKIRIKGLLGGYDEFFGEVLMIKCEVVEMSQAKQQH